MLLRLPLKPLVPALQNAPLLTIHVGMAVISYGTFATSFAAGVAYLAQGKNDRFRWLPSHKTLDGLQSKVAEVAGGHATLETVFLTLTGRSLRD